jgi:hypothetical protein
MYLSKNGRYEFLYPSVIYQSTFIYLAIYLLKANERTEYSDYLNEIA